jgi:hypothetical protein
MAVEAGSTLSLTYEQFVAVLRKWDAYTFIEFREMPRGFPVATDGFLMSSGNYVPPGMADAVDVEFSKLAELLWKTLEAGPKEVDRIHDEYFAEEQAKHFRETYESPEHVAALIEEDYHYTLEPPTHMFMKLGKPAQMILVRDGVLQRAVENYERGKEAKKQEEEEAELARREHKAKEKRVNKNAKLIRELDKSQCVFCGKKLFGHLKYVRAAGGPYEVLERSQLSEEGIETEVLLACMPCASAVDGKVAEGADKSPVYGRFDGQK